MHPMTVMVFVTAFVPFMISALLRTVGGYEPSQCLLLWIGLTSAFGFSFCLIAIKNYSERFNQISESQRDELQRMRECIISVTSRNRDFSN